MRLERAPVSLLGSGARGVTVVRADALGEVQAHARWLVERQGPARPARSSLRVGALTCPGVRCEVLARTRLAGFDCDLACAVRWSGNIA